MFLPLPVCVKSSEVLVSLVSCTINPESVLNLCARKTDLVSHCLLHLCHVRLVMSVVLFSVRVATSESCIASSPGLLRLSGVVCHVHPVDPRGIARVCVAH